MYTSPYVFLFVEEIISLRNRMVIVVAEARRNDDDPVRGEELFHPLYLGYRAVKHILSRTNSVVIIARKASPSSLHVEIVLVYNRYTRNWNNTFLTANCRTITLQSGIKAVTHTQTHTYIYIYMATPRVIKLDIVPSSLYRSGSWKMIANRSSRVCIYTGRWNRFIKSWREVIIGAEIGGWDRWIKERDEIDRESGSECLSPSRYDGHVSCIREKNCDKSESIIIRQ